LQNIWDVAGDSDEPDVNRMTFQPIPDKSCTNASMESRQSSYLETLDMDLIPNIMQHTLQFTDSLPVSKIIKANALSENRWVREQY